MFPNGEVTPHAPISRVWKECAKGFLVIKVTQLNLPKFSYLSLNLKHTTNRLDQGGLGPQTHTLITQSDIKKTIPPPQDIRDSVSCFPGAKTRDHLVLGPPLHKSSISLENANQGTSCPLTEGNTHSVEKFKFLLCIIKSLSPFVDSLHALDAHHKF